MTYTDSGKPRHYSELRPANAGRIQREIEQIEERDEEVAQMERDALAAAEQHARDDDIASLRTEMRREIAALREQFAAVDAQQDAAREKHADEILATFTSIGDAIEQIERGIERRLLTVEQRLDVLRDYAGNESKRMLSDLRRQITGERVQNVKDIIAAVLATCDQTIESRLAAIERQRASEREMMIKLLLDHGIAAKMPKVKGTFSARENYSALDICVRDGAGWIARRDDPAGIPGDSGDWQLLSMRGARGVAGEKGERGYSGTPGDDAARIIGWQHDYERYVAIPRLSDGSIGAPLDLRGFFAAFQNETT
jgi:hypothetical protein